MTALDFYEQEKKNIKVEASDDASITFKRLMVKFANMYHLEQLRLHVVSQQSELLNFFAEEWNKKQTTIVNCINKDDIGNCIEKFNCG